MTLEQDRPPLATPHDLREKLAGGLFVSYDHLKEMVRLSAELADETLQPTVFRIIGGLFGRLLTDWEEGPLTVDRATRIEDTLREPLIRLIDGVIERVEGKKILELMNDLTFKADLLKHPTLNES